MSGHELSVQDRDWLRRSREASGVPARISDPAAVARVVGLVVASALPRDPGVDGLPAVSAAFEEVRRETG